MTAFQPGVSEPLYAFEIAYCRGSHWHAMRRMLEERLSPAHWSVLLALGAASMLLPVTLYA